MAHRHLPAFVYSKSPSLMPDEVPVFTFHYVEPVSFEAQLKFLQRNGYTALSGQEFENFLLGKFSAPSRSVLLTFDDGSASLFSVAFPLLKKYGFRAVSFIIPGLISETAPESPTYSDFVAGKADINELLRREKGDFPLCSWEEIREMHRSGTVEFHSHSLYHHLISVAPELVDFLHPGYKAYYFGRINIPVYRLNGKPYFDRQMPLGTPIFRAEPRYYALPEFLDNEAVRRECIDYVSRKGGAQFFAKRHWRSELRGIFQDARRKFGAGKYQSREEQEEDILADLTESKRRIEAELPGHKVTQFCYPWFIGSELAVRLSRRAGYRVNFWGIIKNRPISRPGADPYHCPRLEDRFLYRLPGEGRWSLLKILQQKFVRYGTRRDPLIRQTNLYAEKAPQFSS